MPQRFTDKTFFQTITQNYKKTMRKFTLSVVALLASATCFAQTTLWNGEDKEIGSDGGVWKDRCNPEVVETPDKDDVNSSDKCLKFTVTGNEWNNGDMAFGIEGNAFASRRISLMIKKDKASNVRVNLKFDDGNFKNVAAWYDGAGKWQKLYFDFFTNGINGNLIEVSVYPNTEVTVSEVVYIDNIVIEDAPMVGGVALKAVDAADLTGNIKLTGAWIKGECQNTDGDPWQKVEYNDFAALGYKLAEKKVTSIDMRGTVTKDVDVNPLFQNPNTIVYADAAYDHSNVVANAKAKSVELTDEYAFNAPYGFDADNVTVKRNIQAGVNSLVLPFELNAEDISVGKLATYTGSDVKSANFESTDHVAANTPMLVFDMAEATELTFGQKYIVETPASFDGEFKGVYVPQSATGFYGIDNEGRLHKGGESATIGAFRAYLQLPEGAEAPAAVALDGTATAIDGIAAGNTGNANAAVYDLGGRRLAGSNLQKGIYIIGGKKVAVK